MKKIEQKVLSLISEYKLLNSRDKVLVALSGGPDSVFLLSFLMKYKRKFRISIGAFHLNHLLRIPDSYKDEEFCRSLCKEANIQFFCIRKKVNLHAKKKNLSVEEAGRELRYSLLEVFASKHNFNKIATGHTSDDNSETMLLNFFKGSGINGLAGIPVVRGNIIRPILNVSKDEIFEYLIHYKIKFRIDESNFTDEYERNFIRNQIIPLIKEKINPSVSQTLMQTAALIRSMLGSFTDLIDSKISSYVRAEGNKVYFNKAGIAGIQRFLIKQIFSHSLLKYFSITPGSGDIKAFYELLSKPKGRIRNLSGGLLAISEKKEILIQKEHLFEAQKPVKLIAGSKVKLNDKIFSISLSKKIPKRLGTDRFTEYLDASITGKNFFIRNWKSGDRFRPLGLTGTKKISDFLTDLGVSFAERKKVLVLTNDSDVLWVIGYRINDKYKITGNTKEVLRLCMK